MAHVHKNNRSTQSPGRSAADNNRSSGISRPAPGIIQKVKIPFYDHKGNQLDTNDGIEVNNHVAYLLQTGNVKEAEELAGHLKDLQDAPSDIEGLNKAQYLAQGIRAALISYRQRQGAKDGFIMQAFTRRNIIIAGERHGIKEIEDKEKMVFGARDINIIYENGRIVEEDKNEVHPDPGAYRILYFMELFYEDLLKYKNDDDIRNKETHIGSMGAAYDRCIKEHGDYTPKQIEKGLAYKGKPIMTYERLYEYRTFMYEILDAVETLDKEAVFERKDVNGSAREIFGITDKVKQLAGRKEGENDPVFREIRSESMFKSIEEDLKTTNKTVYKVGNNHILDIIKQANGEQPYWVFTEGQYLNELEKLSAK